MIVRAAGERVSYIDVEVLQRLLKSLDAVFLGLGALTITFGMAQAAPISDHDALIGFFTVELVLLSMLVMRSLGLYEIATLGNGPKSIALSIAVCLACGTLNYLVARIGLLDLPL